MLYLKCISDWGNVNLFVMLIPNLLVTNMLLCTSYTRARRSLSVPWILRVKSLSPHISVAGWLLVAFSLSLSFVWSLNLFSPPFAFHFAASTLLLIALMLRPHFPFSLRLFLFSYEGPPVIYRNSSQAPFSTDSSHVHTHMCGTHIGTLLHNHMMLD